MSFLTMRKRKFIAIVKTPIPDHTVEKIRMAIESLLAISIIEESFEEKEVGEFKG